MVAAFQLVAFVVGAFIAIAVIELAVIAATALFFETQDRWRRAHYRRTAR